jgi:hypothetical protein
MLLSNQNLHMLFVRAAHGEEEGGKSEENLPLTAGIRCDCQCFYST